MPKQKQKSHKGVLKRVKVTARGKVKYRKAFSGHLLSHKDGQRKQRLRKAQLAKKGDMKRLTGLLHRPLQAGDTAEPPKRDQTNAN
jgi:large subunit ribosomal protein L35